MTTLAGQLPSDHGRKSFAATTRPANKSCRAANHQSVIRYIPRDHCTGSDHRPSSDIQPRQGCGVGSYAATLLEQYPQKLGWILFAARSLVISKAGVGTDKNVVLDGNSIPERDAAFYGHAIADSNSTFDK